MCHDTATWAPAAPREPLESSAIDNSNLLLLLLLGVLGWRWARSRSVARIRREVAGASPQATGQRELKDAINAIAVEVERISGNQRLVTKLVGEKLSAGAQRAAPSPR